eukprot:8775238-Alexandrium_andersonii.AAC.1
MSASLVGSEMCIRDRGWRELAKAGGGWREMEKAGGGWREGLGRPEREPVSYTHLTLPTICSV